MSPKKIKIGAFCKNHQTPAKSRNGFALIISLSLMAFIVLLILSLSSLVKVEVATQQIVEKQSEARDSALLGLEVALAQLQEFAGPDQRITVRSDIFNSSAAGRNHYTLVYNNAPNPSGLTPFEQGIAPEVLVSGDLNLADLQIPINSNTANAAQLVGDNTVNLSTDEVYAPLVDITDLNGGVSARYAYWIADEGIKAKVNIYDALGDGSDSDGLTTEDRINRYLSAQTANLTNTDPNNLFVNYNALSSGIARVSSIQDLEYELDLVGSIQGDYFHDLSTQSVGLLVDVKNGGLKHDLTHIFEHNDVFNREFSSTSGWSSDYIFRPAGTTLGNFSNYGAPNWGILRDYYQQHTDHNNGSMTRILSDTNTNPFDLPHTSSNDIYHQTSPVSQVLSMLQIGIAIEYVKTDVARNGFPDGNDHYYPRLHFRPIISFYNPYDVTLSTNPRISWFFAPRIEITVGGQTVEFQPSDIMPRATFSSSKRFRWQITNNDFRPGETRMYALNDQFHMTNTNFDPRMISDYSSSGSYYINITRDSAVGGKVKNSNFYDNAEFVDDGASSAPPIEITIKFHQQGTNISGILYISDANDGTGQFPNYQAFHNLYDKNQDDDNPDFTGDVRRLPDPISYSKSSVLDLTEFDGNLPRSIATLRLMLRDANTSQEPFRFLVDGNVRALVGSAQSEGFTGGNALSYTGVFTGESYESFDNVAPDVSDLGRYSGYWGMSRDANTGADRVVLFHTPRDRLISLGYLQHANTGRFTKEATYPFANSYAPMRVPLNGLEDDFRGALNFDFGYEMNDRIWDRYYFSSIPQNLTDAQLNQYLTGQKTLPLARYRLYEPEELGLSAQLLTDTGPATTSQSVSGRLLIDGAFNINSTSVDAWKTIFGSLHRPEIPVYNETTGDLAQFDTPGQPFVSRTGAPFDEDMWNGYRQLSQADIESLAAEMVSEIRARGPARSLSEFVNRDPFSTNPDFQRRGRLQAVIDRVLNLNLNEAGIAAKGVDGYGDAFLNAEDRQGMAFPGWVLQADFLQPLAPILTVRSDTFTIRAYGESIDPITQQVLAKAWCEAVVQRLPDPVENNTLTTQNQQEAHLIKPTTPTGTAGERRFQVTSFRWLPESSI